MSQDQLKKSASILGSGNESGKESGYEADSGELTLIPILDGGVAGKSPIELPFTLLPGIIYEDDDCFARETVN